MTSTKNKNKNKNPDVTPDEENVSPGEPTNELDEAKRGEAAQKQQPASTTSATETAATGISPSESTTDNVLPNSGDHDRVAMLSRKPDGSLDQINPEVIGDKEQAIAASKEQLAQQAVSAVDAAEQAAQSASQVEQTQDPTIQRRQDVHKHVAEAAKKQAEADVEALHKGV